MGEQSESRLTLPATHSRAEQQPRPSLEPALTTLQHFLRTTYDALIVRDKDGRILFWNRSAEQLYGWTAAEALGQNADSLLKTKFLTPLSEIELKLYSCGSWEGELVQTARDGRDLVMRNRWSLEADEEGVWAGVIQVESDITNQRQLEEELRQAKIHLESEADQRLAELEAANEALVESQARFRQVAEAIRDVFWLTNPWRTSIIYVNPAYEQIWGRSCQSLYANPRSWLEAVHPEDRPRMRQFFTRPISEKGYEQTYRIVRPDCSVRWILDRGFPIRDRTGSLSRVAGIARDVTDRKELEKEILAISEREQQRIGQDLHDDLCQQLVGTEFLCKALQQQLKAQPQVTKVAEIAQLIRSAINYTRQLARGMAPLELEAEGLMRGLQALATRTGELFRIECLFECTDVVLVQDLTVGTHLYRIAQEAVSNSIKHGKATRITIGLNTKAERGILTIADNGCGFAVEPYGFGGLGLRTMRYRADVIGGICSIQSGPSSGTCITCSFPLTNW